MPNPSRLNSFAYVLTVAVWAFALLLLPGCDDDDEQSFGPGPDPDPGLFDRFEAETLLDNTVIGALPTQVRFFPDDPTRALIVHQAGRVSVVTTDGETASLVGRFDIPGVNLEPGELGVTDVIFDPDFATNRFFYVTYAPGDNTVHRVGRMTWSDDLPSVAASRISS